MAQRCNRHQGIYPKNPFSRFCNPENDYIPSMSIMIMKSWLLPFCLLMFFSEIFSQDCSNLRHDLKEANKANLELLNIKMGSTIPLQCVDDVINFSSKPNEESLPSIYDFEEANATVAIDEILQQISYLFNQNHTKLSWDESAIANFKLGVEEEIKKLTPCLAERIDELREKVRKYFQRIKDLLKDKEYSLCAWEIVQMEVRQCLIVADQLISRIAKKAPVIILEVNETETETETEPTTKEPESTVPCTPQGGSNAGTKQEVQLGLPAVIDTVIQEQQLNELSNMKAT